ncbi:PAS domain-containing protein [Novosphingobium sp. JCM 18896]|uniref:PAS domain-containing protein n=1 Tax=Novosphingobium sp. JCM 18896 TaxID=2989731 RepID=UPI0022222800|nr:PAS domain-containing protein [Novosphingobium sp. JCM 18896]MCW1432239.1 PAS domain-containing protein [Novosphingobium sp. JCM 18896]
MAASNEEGASTSPESSEKKRGQAIAAYGFDDLIDDPELARITAFASGLCDCPIALVSIVEAARQRFIARTGLQATETPRSMSFCAHAMVGQQVMEVPNAAADDRFFDNPLVTGEPHIRFYAGAPLVSSSGEALGSLCVISPLPRSSLTPLQKEGLIVLAQAVMRRLEERRSTLRHEAWEGAVQADLAASEERFRVLADTMPQMVWSTRPDGYHDYYNARWYEFTGAVVGETDGSGWNGQFHPEDQARAWETWRHSLETGDPYEIEYRLRRHDGEFRWTLGRALPIRNSGGDIVRWFGTCTDIHDQRLLQDQKDLLSRELGHRIKNIFMVVASLVRLSAREEADLKPFGEKMSAQIAALGRAYDYMRPQEGVTQFSLQGMLNELFAAYTREGDVRIRIRGDDLSLPERYMTPLALTFHELATNAVKYGALSDNAGHVDLEITRRHDEVELAWAEIGGPRYEPSERRGFGSTLVETSIKRQLRGDFVQHWLPSGLKAISVVPLDF